jgi:hypothetical protein
MNDLSDRNYARRSARSAIISKGSEESRRANLASYWLLFALTLALIVTATTAFAHHGWRWTADGNFELTGLITKAELGNPHGVLTMDADGEIWLVEVGQPWRNERAGLSDDMLAPGKEITVSGQRDADPEKKRMKAERVIIAGKLHDLYPDRD